MEKSSPPHISISISAKFLSLFFMKLKRGAKIGFPTKFLAFIYIYIYILYIYKLCNDSCLRFRI